MFQEPKPNPWSIIRRRLSKGTIKFVPGESTFSSDTEAKDIEMKESLVKHDPLPKRPSTDLTRIEDSQTIVDRDHSIESDATKYDFNRRRATSCVEISPRMVENLKKESELSQDKADSLDNFLSKLTAKNGSQANSMYSTGKQPSMRSLQSFAKLTVHSKSTQDLKPKKTEKFAQVGIHCCE